MKILKFVALAAMAAVMAAAMCACGEAAPEEKGEPAMEKEFNTPVAGAKTADKFLEATEYEAAPESAYENGMPKMLADGDRITFEPGKYILRETLVIGKDASGKTLDFAGTYIEAPNVIIEDCEKTVVTNMNAVTNIEISDSCADIGVVNSALLSLTDKSKTGAIIENNTLALVKIAASTILRGNTVKTVQTVEHKGKLQNVYIAANKMVTLDASECYNPTLVSNYFEGPGSYAAVSDSEFLTAADNKFESNHPYTLKNVRNALINGRGKAFTEAEADIHDCSQVYGSDIAGDDSVTVGCDESRLPQVDNMRYFGMERRDTVRYVDLQSGEWREEPVREYVMSRAASNSTLMIPAGAYKIEMKDNSHFAFDGLSCFRMDAYGVFFEFEKYTTSAFDLQNCTAFDLRGLTMDYELVSNTQGTVVRNGIEYIILKIDEGYPELIDNPEYYDITNGVEGFRSGSDRPYMDLSLGDRIRQDDGSFKIRGYTNLSAGDKVIFRGKFAHVNKFQNCAETSYEDVTVLGGSGFGFCEGGGAGNTHLNRVAFTPGPSPIKGGEPRLISVCDATHTTNMRAGIKVTNCLFEKMTDDATNINGTYGDVYAFDSSTKTLIYGEGTSNYGTCCWDFKEGDRALIYTRDGKLLCDAKAMSATTGEGKNRAITLDKTFETKPGDMVIENASTNGDGFLYDNCVVQNNRSRGFLIKAPNGTIKNCSLRDNGMSAILVKPEISDNWGECGFSWNLTIENNMIERSGFYTGSELHSPINVSSDREPIADVSYMLHKNIVIRNNVFRDRYTTYAINANGVDGMTIEGNDFGTRIDKYLGFASPIVNPLYGDGDDEAYAVKLAGVNDVKVQDNTFAKSSAGVLVDETALKISGKDIK